METVKRIAELESELKRRDDKIKELTTERDEAHKLVDQMRENTERHNETIDQWIEVFGMLENDKGIWIFDPEQTKLWEQYDALLTDYLRLIRQWNKFIAEYNAAVRPRERGRPLAASEAQCADVIKRRKSGEPLRKIAYATGLGVRTVCTILDKGTARDRTAKRTNLLRRQQFDRLRAANYRAKKRARENLPKQIDEQLKAGAVLLKAAKGIGR